ncbi:MAG: hypothetical protein KBS60_01235 [Phascolarctobacterium sp.]|nr:hypothetical protein [Candidatus Phascolarctobacterium caballi]
MSIGTKLPKPCPQNQWLEARKWAMGHNATIEDKGNYYEIVAIPAPSVEELQSQRRGVRDNYLNGIEWRVDRYKDQLALGIPTNDTETTYRAVLQYMQYLRDYPNNLGGNWWEEDPLTFEKWLEING